MAASGRSGRSRCARVRRKFACGRGRVASAFSSLLCRSYELFADAISRLSTSADTIFADLDPEFDGNPLGIPSGVLGDWAEDGTVDDASNTVAVSATSIGSHEAARRYPMGHGSVARTSRSGRSRPVISTFPSSVNCLRRTFRSAMSSSRVRSRW
jgi:hypothetical protein